MTGNGFIKYHPSSSSERLRENFPKAYLLLSLIAERVRRFSGHEDGLEIGHALIGDHSAAGLTRQEYRTALKNLVDFSIIKIVTSGNAPRANHKPTTKSTTKSTTRGTLVCLLDSTIWEIISEKPTTKSTSKSPKINHELDIYIPIPDTLSIKEPYSNTLLGVQRSRSASPPRSDDIFFDVSSKSFQGIKSDDLASWKQAYPLVDISQSLANMAEWLLSNPQRSNKKLWRKFITGWLGRNQNQLENRKAYQDSAKYSQKPISRSSGPNPQYDNIF